MQTISETKTASALLAAKKHAPSILLVAALALAAPAIVEAATSGSALPWEGPLDKFTASIRGPVAYAISLLGIVGVAWGFVFGGELNQFLRGGIILVAAIALLTGGAAVMSGLFNQGAVIVANLGPLYGA